MSDAGEDRSKQREFFTQTTHRRVSAHLIGPKALAVIHLLFFFQEYAFPLVEEKAWAAATGSILL